MNNIIKVSDRIYYLGVNDRRKQLFENQWPLPNGVAYNSYLIADQKTALIDTVEVGTAGDYTGWIASILNGRTLDYLVINHMEPDHSGEIGNIIRNYPNIKIIGNNKTFKILEAYFGVKHNLMEVCDGDELDLGHHKLKFVMTPWVHWPETMMTYDLTEKILFSADAFGTFGALSGGVFDDELDFSLYEDEMRRYYSNIVGKYSGMVQKAFLKLAQFEIKTICSLHGPVWRTNPSKVIGLYDKWSKQEAEDGVVVVYASMYGNTTRIADYIARQVGLAGVKNIRVYDVSKTHMSYIISDIWKYNGVILGSCAYNSEMFPAMESLTREFEHMGVKKKYLGVFGSHSWNGGGVKKLMEFAERIKWELVADPVDINGNPTPEKIVCCDTIAECMAKKINQK